jgi:hypothetical protein
VIDNGARSRKKSLAALEPSREKKREVIKMLKNDYPISLLCDLLAMSRSSFCYHPTEADESKLRGGHQSTRGAVPDLRLTTADSATAAPALSDDRQPQAGAACNVPGVDPLPCQTTNDPNHRQ